MAAFRSWLLLCRQTGETVIRYWNDLGSCLRFIGEVTLILCSALCRPWRMRWRLVFYKMDCYGSQAVPIISLLGVLIGVILAFQALTLLGRYGVQSFVVNLVCSVIITELAPLMTAVVLAGRTGSAIAAEIGTMKTNEEIDAMETMGLASGSFLVTPNLLALLLVFPGLTIIADFCGTLGGWLIVQAKLDFSLREYYVQALEMVRPVDLIQGLVKSLLFGVIVGGVGCWKGLEAPRDAQGVGNAATQATVTSIFLIVIADAALTAVFS